MARTQYKPEFKMRIIEAADKGESVQALCKRHGLQAPRVYEWIRYRADIEEAIDKAAIAAHGERDDLTLDDVRQLSLTPTAQAPQHLKLIQAEIELLREENNALRTRYLALKVGAA